MIETPPARWLTAAGRLTAALGWRDGAGRSFEVRDDPARRHKDKLLGHRASGPEILRWNQTESRPHYRDGGKSRSAGPDLPRFGRHGVCLDRSLLDRKSTRLNSSHANISYA